MRPICIAVSLVLAGCSSILDLDRFQQAENLTVFLTNMEMYVDSLVEVRIVNQQTGVVEGRGVIEGFLLAEARGDGVRVPFWSARPPTDTFEVQVFADDDENGVLDEQDLSWVAPVTGPVVEVQGGRDRATTVDATEDQGAMFQYTLRDFFGPHAGQRLELAVVDQSNGRAVGYFSTREIPEAGDLLVRIDGIIQDGRMYEIQYYADLDRTQNFSAGDHAWIDMHRGTADGLREAFTHAAPFNAPLNAFGE